MVSGIESIHNTQAVFSTRNYEGINNLDPTVRAKVKDEFLALFYKELLKQAFKPPTLGMGSNENNSFSGVFSTDLMVEKLALELARSQAFSAESLFPSIAETEKSK